MKLAFRHLALVCMIFMVALSLIAVGDRGGIQQVVEQKELSELDRLSIEMELSLLEFQKDLPEKQQEPLERRKAIRAWRELNSEKMDRMEKLRKKHLADSQGSRVENLETARLERKLPNLIPIFDGSDASVFLADANEYLQNVSDFHQPMTGEDRLKSRSELSRYMKKPEQLQLRRDLVSELIFF